MKPFSALMAQINPTVGDIRGNVEKIKNSLESAERLGSQLVVFPELVVTGYPPEDLLFRSAFVDENLRAVKELARHTHHAAAIVGFVDKDKKGRLYNAAAVLSKGKILGIYHKNELPNYGVFDEKRYFEAGEGDFIFKLGSTRIGVTICEDIWQKDAYVYQEKYVGRVDLLVNLSASPYHVDKELLRLNLLKTLAKRTKANILYLNITGGQDELVFDGCSMAVSASGKLLAQAKRFAEDLCPVTFFSKTSGIPFKHASREEAVYQALVMGTHNYIKKNGFKKVLIGLSGGIDSALVARIAVDALGAGNVIGVTMPSPYTSSGTYKDAYVLAKNLGIECLEFKIDKIYGHYLDLLSPSFKGLKPNIAEENLQARIRGNLLMALSNKFGHLVLTTGNKSEMATGYCTLYGDMAGGFAVIKDVPKTMVFRLSRWRNAVAPENSIPDSIIKRPPTAELRHNQKDQDTLPPYAELDRILEMYVEKDLSASQITEKGLSGKSVARTARMVDISEYKRRQAPPGVKITPRAFGRDRRMPITNRCAGH